MPGLPANVLWLSDHKATSFLAPNKLHSIKRTLDVDGDSFLLKITWYYWNELWICGNYLGLDFLAFYLSLGYLYSSGSYSTRLRTRLASVKCLFLGPVLSTQQFIVSRAYHYFETCYWQGNAATRYFCNRVRVGRLPRSRFERLESFGSLDDSTANAFI